MIKKNQNGQLSVVMSPGTTGNGYIVGSVQNDVSAAKASSYLYGEAGRVLSSMNMDIVQERIFGHASKKEAIVKARRAALQKGEEILFDELFSYIDCEPVFGRGFAGFILRVAAREKVQTILYDNKPCGKKWFEGNAQHIILQDLNGTGSAQVASARETEVGNMLHKADAILQASGGSYRDVVRTWFYLPDILNWYGRFNAVRNDVYTQFRLMHSLGSGVLSLPSSTGIGVGNTRKSAGTLNLYAVVGPQAGKPHIRQLSNAGQKNAYEYGAAFSRGTVISNARTKLMQLSGTAAINRRGQSLFHESCTEQIDCTFEKIRELLRPLRAGLSDICAATVFLKNKRDINQLKNSLAAHGLSELPCVYVVADICRPELLFELDGELLFHDTTGAH